MNDSRTHPRRRRHALAFSTLSVCLGSAACGPGGGESDEPLMAPGKPEVQLGMMGESGYSALRDGDEALVIWGLQGGTWTMPLLRTRGIQSPSQVEAGLVSSGGEPLGESEGVQPLYPTADGWLETDAFAVPVQHGPPHEFDSIEDLYGQTATLAVRVWDDAGREASYEVGVLLTESR